MKSYDVVIAGAGPAGSACAAELAGAGLGVAILDRETFPRTKLCAGWITPKVVRDLGLDIEAYPHRFNTFDHLVIHIRSLKFRVKSVQHSIRRYEFDDYLLHRSGAEFHHHNVRAITRHGEMFEIDGRFRCRYLVGAGGTRCPVYREFFRQLNPRARDLQIVTLEQEFPYDWDDPDCHLWFLRPGLPGYSWYVPKADGYMNCGIGGLATRLNAGDRDIRWHWEDFVAQLSRLGLVRNVRFKPKGYSYYLRHGVERVRSGNAFIIGDAVGLATRDLAEGIGPAIESGQRAAGAILGRQDYDLKGMAANTMSSPLPQIAIAARRFG